MDRPNIRKELDETIVALSKWIRECCERGTSSEELRVLPEVVNATAKLYETIR